VVPVGHSLKLDHATGSVQMAELQIICDVTVNLVTVEDAALELTVVGQTGVLGIPVMRPVELVIKSVSETAHNQHLNMTGKIAWEKHSRNSCANCHPALLMEVGQIGVNGLLAATLAEVFKNAFEIAQIQSPGLAENLAKEISGKIMNARIFVETYLAVCSKFHESV